ncbi:MAG: hypothetical protein KAH32_01610 [Chlamydiia bacterium]|nr:hypothetical protein [Chlamydiia bacterium]
MDRLNNTQSTNHELTPKDSRFPVIGAVRSSLLYLFNEVKSIGQNMSILKSRLSTLASNIKDSSASLDNDVNAGHLSYVKNNLSFKNLVSLTTVWSILKYTFAGIVYGALRLAETVGVLILLEPRKPIEDIEISDSNLSIYKMPDNPTKCQKILSQFQIGLAGDSKFFKRKVDQNLMSIFQFKFCKCQEASRFHYIIGKMIDEKRYVDAQFRDTDARNEGLFRSIVRKNIIDHSNEKDEKKKKIFFERLKTEGKIPSENIQSYDLVNGIYTGHGHALIVHYEVEFKTHSDGIFKILKEPKNIENLIESVTKDQKDLIKLRKATINRLQVQVSGQPSIPSEDELSETKAIKVEYALLTSLIEQANCQIIFLSQALYGSPVDLQYYIGPQISDEVYDQIFYDKERHPVSSPSPVS